MSFAPLHIGVLAEPDHFHTRKWVKSLQAAGARVTIFSFSPTIIPEAPCVQVIPNAQWKGKHTYLSYLFSGKKLLTALHTHGVDVVNPIDVTPFGVWGRVSGFRPMAMVSMGADILEYPPTTTLLPFPASRSWSSEDPEPLGASDRLIFGLKWRIFRHQVKKALDASAFITGDNLHLVDSVKAYFDIPAEKVRLHRWGVEPELFEHNPATLARLKKRLNIQPGELVVMSPRGLKPIYQGDIILEGFRLMMESGACPHVRFIALSAGYDIPAAIDLKARKLEADYEQFTYVSEVLPREDVLALWPLCQIMISAPVYDGYSNALSEARYAGVIPVVNDIPASQELLIHQENGWYVSPFTPEQLSNELGTLLANLEHWKHKFAGPNRSWIEANAMLTTNMARFYSWCREISPRKISE